MKRTQKSTYSVKIKHYNRIFKGTVKIYREAVAFFIDVAHREWGRFESLKYKNDATNIMESLTHQTKSHPIVKYNFDVLFPMMPCYLMRSAIMEAIGKVSEYQTNKKNWEDNGKQGKEPSYPIPGLSFPAMYKGNMFLQTGNYEARIKIWNGREWAWLDIELRKSDMDYITRHCSEQKRLSPRLQRRGKEWFLDFPFEGAYTLNDTPLEDQMILAVDLGIDNACTCVAMTADGAVHGRHFLKLLVETDRLWTSVNRIKKAQQSGAKHKPRLWGTANGINKDIAVKTAKFIIDTAVLYNADVIIFEHLDTNDKKHGSQKHKMHLWKANGVQDMVIHKAHALGMHVNRVCAKNTSKLAFDGSGKVSRGSYVQDGSVRHNQTMCMLQNGKLYNCDLNAAYNIGARYFIREILKSLPETSRLALEAKDPSLAKRSTSTLSTLFNLDAELERLVA